MGAADAIPGVSGGTIALVLGIYERLLASIGHAARGVIALLRIDREGARYHVGAVDWKLVVPLAGGIGAAIVVASAFVPQLLDLYPTQSRGLFLGLVVASVSIPWHRVRVKAAPHVMVAVAAGILAFVLTGIPPGTVTDPSSLQVFGAAAIAICAMILPGVSGSYLLLVLGLYETTLDAVHDRNLTYVAVFASGAAVGLGLFSMVLNALLRRHHDLTMAALVGLMVGSLRALWPWQNADRGLELPNAVGDTVVVAALVIFGFAMVRLLELVSQRRTEPPYPR